MTLLSSVDVYLRIVETLRKKLTTDYKAQIRGPFIKIYSCDYVKTYNYCVNKFLIFMKVYYLNPNLYKLIFRGHKNEHL